MASSQAGGAESHRSCMRISVLNNNWIQCEDHHFQYGFQPSVAIRTHMFSDYFEVEMSIIMLRREAPLRMPCQIAKLLKILNRQRRVSVTSKLSFPGILLMVSSSSASMYSRTARVLSDGSRQLTSSSPGMLRCQKTF